MDEKTKELSHVAGFLRRQKRELSKAPLFLGPPWTVEVLSARHPREASGLAALWLGKNTDGPRSHDSRLQPCLCLQLCDFGETLSTHLAP